MNARFDLPVDPTIASTHFLSDEEFGIYMRMQLYSRRSKLPADPTALGRLLHRNPKSSKSWSSVDFVIANFWQPNGPVLEHRDTRLDKRPGVLARLMAAYLNLHKFWPLWS